MIFVIIILAIILILVIYLIIPFKYPWPTESDYSHRLTPYWHLNYSHKYLRARKRAAKNSGLEQYFQDMRFELNKFKLDNPREITIKAVGDIMYRRDFLGSGGENLWDDTGEYLFDADLKIGNMEFAINPNRVIEKIVQFSVPPSYSDPLLGDPRFGKFNLLTLGNNHINDSFFEGIKSSCDYLDSIDMKHVGANRTPEEQDDFPIFEMKGIKIAVLSYSFSTNDVPLDKDRPFSVNLVRFNALKEKDYDPSLILKHIKIAKERGADYIISCHHWGLEFEYYPPERIVKRAHELLEAGIDLIIGHHPHILNPIEHYVAKDKRDCLVFYSLGSLTTSALIGDIHKLSEIAEIVLETGHDENGNIRINVKKVALTPVIHSLNKVEGKYNNRLLPLKRSFQYIAEGNIPEHFSRKDIRRIKYCKKEFERYFLPDGGGVEYR
jgi:poly-gamma-glutamate synthesis protein (capsule biosynthesis protein)